MTATPPSCDCDPQGNWVRLAAKRELGPLLITDASWQRVSIVINDPIKDKHGKDYPCHARQNKSSCDGLESFGLSSVTAEEAALEFVSISSSAIVLNECGVSTV